MKGIHYVFPEDADDEEDSISLKRNKKRGKMELGKGGDGFSLLWNQKDTLVGSR